MGEERKNIHEKKKRMTKKLGMHGPRPTVRLQPFDSAALIVNHKSLFFLVENHKSLINTCKRQNPMGYAYIVSQNDSSVFPMHHSYIVFPMHHSYIYHLRPNRFSQKRPNRWPVTVGLTTKEMIKSNIFKTNVALAIPYIHLNYDKKNIQHFNWIIVSFRFGIFFSR